MLPLTKKLLYLCLTLLFVTVSCLAWGQDGVSTAGLARTKFLGKLGVIPSPQEVVVEDFINYPRHEIGRPKAGEAVAMDVRWGNDSLSKSGEAILQVGQSTALTHDRDELRPLNLCLVIDKSGSMAEDNKLSRVKTAILTLVAQLRSKDILSIVVFDSEPSVLLPAQPVTDQARIQKIIQSIEPGSATNLSGGLNLGYQEVLKCFDKDSTNRVILLTDGIANRGITDPDKISRASLSYNDRGIDLSTIGVGRDLNKELLSELAKSGRGLFHFVADWEDIEKVFVKELQSLISPVAAEPNLKISYAPGLELEKIYGYEPKVGDRSVKLRLDNMNSGMTEVVLLRFKSRGDGETSRLPITVSLDYHDLKRDKEIETIQETSIPSGEVRTTEVGGDPSVAKNYTIAILAQSINDMASDCQGSRYDRAESVLNNAINKTARLYPHLEDEDIKRTLTLAQHYQGVVHEENQRRGLRVIERDAAFSSPSTGNVVPNGDFALGNTGFTSGIDYIAPGLDCLWGGAYTIVPGFSNPTLHHLVIPGDYSAPRHPNGNEQVYFANTGGNGSLTLWSTVVKCKPHTRYRISFQSISLSGSQPANGHEIPTPDWVPNYEIRIGGESSDPQPAGCGQYTEISMIWDSKNETTPSLNIVRMPNSHWGGVIGLTNIEMIPVGN